MKSLYVPFLEKDEGRMALSAAIDIAKVFSSKICASYIQPHPNAAIPYGMEPMLVSYINETADKLIEAGQKWEADLRGEYEKVCNENSVKILSSKEKAPTDAASAVWQSFLGIPNRDYGRAARACDLSILLKQEGDVGARPEILEEIIFHSGRPAVLVPHKTKIDLTGSALVAWNGSIEAVHAISAAMPILEKTKKVYLLTIGKVIEACPMPADMAEYLTLHGAEVEVLEIDPPTDSVEQALTEQVNKVKASLVVMGAYTHSRLQELLFGGVTRHMLKNTNVPILMAH